MSNLLINESPVLILPSLAEKIGLNEAIVLQQLHFWLSVTQKRKDRNKFREGAWWVFNSYDEWQENFPWWSTRTIQRIINKLEKEELIVSKQFESQDWDQRKWYTIDYNQLDKLSCSMTTTCRDHNKNTENTTEINLTDKKNGSSDEDDEIREILGDEVIERNEKIRANSTLVRKGTQAALHEGIMTESDLKTRVMRAFSINPKWERKDWRSVLQFLKERPLEETIERWARWWKSEDWRGKEGQPPTASQIEELWPQAFSSESGEVRKNEDGSFYV